ncbi:MAG: ABC transporter permease [Candidatus Pseudothioglobus sp.]
MPSSIHDFRRSNLFRAAIIVPTLIALIFSIFNLTAPNDPEKISSNFRLGIVNLDSSTSFPLISTQAIKAISRSLPFRVKLFKDSEGAETALSNGQISSVIIFPEDFSDLALSQESLNIKVINSDHLTISETQIASQLPSTFQLGLSAFISNLRLAKFQNKAPSSEMPIQIELENLYEAQSLASVPSPFVMSFVAWLSSMVGSVLLFLATSQMPYLNRAYIRTVIPIMTMGLSSLALALVVTFTTLQWEVFFMSWMVSWLIGICLSWFFLGVFATIGLFGLLVILPVVFYQSALSGTMIPLTAAPDWLEFIGSMVPFDSIGSTYRSVIFGSNGSIPFLWLGSAAIIGLFLSWVSDILRGRMKRRW